MENIIKLAREIGMEIQKEDAYIQLGIAQQQSDEDKELQDLIGEFNLKRMAINNEASSPTRDDEKLQTLNSEMREVYQTIMANENMKNYNDKKQAMDTLVQRVVAIITQSAQGEDPTTTDYSPSCGGSCSSCSGC